MYEEEIKKLERHIGSGKVQDYQLIKELDVLRYYYKENEDEDKVKYNEEEDNIEISKSLEIGKKIAEIIPKEIKNIENEEDRQEALKILKNNYYYLGGYLFSYYLVAIEFGIKAEKQFLAPRESVLMPIARELEIFYYKPKAVMTISMPQGTGKEQPLSSNILTPNGWVKMEEIKVGSKVIGADGRACNVTGVYPKGIKDVYRVTFDDKTYVDCGLEHLWEVRTCEDRRNKKEPRIVNTEYMLKNIKVKSDHNRNNYSIRLVKPIEFYNRLTIDDIDPYVLGCLIGNGTLGKEQIRFTQNDKEVISKISKKIFKACKIIKYNQKYQYGIIRKEYKKRTRNPILKKLEDYQLLNKKSNEKFIPKKFLYSSVENRLELLRGLMDTDGNACYGCSLCQYTTTSCQLKDDIIELIRGLGGKARYRTEQTILKFSKENKKNKIYRVYFSIDINPFYLKRKAEKYRKPVFNYQKMIVNIEKVRQEECQCIMIDHPEHLYVTDGYTLTHNTELGKRFMSWCVGKDCDLPSMMTSYSASIAKEKFYRTE